MKVVQSHHQVLSLWAEYRKTLKQAPILITLDHHTDTSFPFRSHLGKQYPEDKSQQQEQRKKLLQKINFLDAESVKDAEALLNHDEHILTALGSDILSAAFVVAQNAQDTDLSTYQEHRVCCFAVGRVSQHVSMAETNKVLESGFLKKALQYFNHVKSQNGETDLFSHNYILDVDLDYFNTLRATQPQDASTYLELFKNAGLVTVATEPEHVVICAREDGLTSAKLLESLKLLHASTH